MTIRFRATGAAALLAVVVIVTACATNEDPAALAAQQVEVDALLAANAAFAAEDYKAAFAGYLPWAQKGDDFSEAQIAYMYYTGLGVAKDEDQARHWYEKAAQDGHLSAATDLGYDYLVPDSGPPDYGQAMKWFTFAADRGDLFADLDLSILYEHGLGVPKDPDQALHFLNQYVARQNVSGPWHYKFPRYPGGDNTGGFMAGLGEVIGQAVGHTGPHLTGQVTQLSFHYADGRATDVAVAGSSGDPVADAAAVAFLQKTLLPPVLPSLSHQERFTIPLWIRSSMFGDGAGLDHEDFATGVRNAIDARKFIPKSVLSNGSKQEHTVRVDFDYLDGKALNAVIVTSSGNPDEDAAAIETVDTASYPPTPSAYAHKKIHMGIYINFGKVTPAAPARSSAAPAAATSSH